MLDGLNAFENYFTLEIDRSETYLQLIYQALIGSFCIINMVLELGGVNFLRPFGRWDSSSYKKNKNHPAFFCSKIGDQLMLIVLTSSWCYFIINYRSIKKYLPGKKKHLSPTSRHFLKMWPSFSRKLGYVSFLEGGRPISPPWTHRGPFQDRLRDVADVITSSAEFGLV